MTEELITLETAKLLKAQDLKKMLESFMNQ